MEVKFKEFIQTYFHGTKANLQPGDTIVANYDSNYAEGMKSKYAYFSSNLNASIWGAELAAGEGPARIYVVEPTGPISDDPNVTNKKFLGNPTNSFRTQDPLRVVGEVIGWQGHAPEEIERRKQAVKRALESGAKIIED